MSVRTQPGERGATNGWQMLRIGVAALIAVLILLQALLAGEWLAGNNVIDVHRAGGFLIVVLALAQLPVVAVAARGRLASALTLAALFFVLTALQLALGLAGFDSANQARALHIVNGVLLFGLACGNVALALWQSGER